MSIAVFNNERYKYYDKVDEILFSEDEAHKKIFDYIAFDLSSVSQILEKYISDRMDMETFGLKPEPQDSGELTEIKTILGNVHPYYLSESDRTIVKAIGEYFNQQLTYSVYRKHIFSSETINDDWYKERLAVLIPESLQIMVSDMGLSVDDFLVEYRKQCGDWNKDLYEETFILDVPWKEPVPFESEIRIQNKIANILYFTLDIDANELSDLTVQQRLWLCGNILKTNLSVTESFAFSEKYLFYSDLGTTEKALEKWHERFNNDLNFIFNELESLDNINIVRDGIPENLQKPFAYAIEESKTATSSGFFQAYKIGDLSQLLTLEILNMIKSQKEIRKCRNCGRYFIVNNRKIAYCDRKDESNRTCSEIGALLSFQKKAKEDEPLKIYMRAYKTHYARYSNRKLSQNELELWREKAKEKLNHVRNGVLSLEEYQKWLKE